MGSPEKAAPGSFAFPASFAQERLWVIEQLTPGEPVYMHAAATRLRGRLDASALQAALDDVVARHESLRTHLELRGHQLMQVIDPGLRVPIRALDAPGRDPLELARELGDEPVDIATGPVVRATLARIAPDDHLLVLVLHHIAADGWSMGVLADELAAAYAARRAGAAPELAELPVQYADWAAWQREWMSGRELDRQVAYWRERLAGAPAHLELPADRPRPALQSFDGDAVPLTIDAELRRRLEELARTGSTTLFVVLLAAWYIVLARWSGQRDLVVITPVAGRTRTETEGLVGLLMNTLALRGDLHGDPTVSELLERVRETVLDALAHQDLPFEKLVEELAPERDLSRSPLAQAMLVLQSAGTGALTLDGLECAPLPMRADMAPYEVTIELDEAPGGGLEGLLIFATSLFERDTAERMAGHFVNALRAVIAGPDRPLSDLGVLDAREAELVLHGWDDVRPELVTGPLVAERVAARAAAEPDRPAAVHGDRVMTYGELDRRANGLAHLLAERGVGPEDTVGVLFERSPELLVALLGTWRAGAAFVPLDSQAPAERSAHLLDRARARLVLSHERLGDVARALAPVSSVLVDAVPEAETPPPVRIGPHTLAYVIFTSGSTGEPKGVMIEHRGFANMVSFAVDVYGIDPGTQWLQLMSITFDGSLTEIFPVLVTGGTLHLAERHELMPGRDLTRLMRRRGITNILVTPSALALMPDTDLPDLANVIACGEALPAETVDRWQPGRRFANAYGPTEITAFCHATECRAGEGTPTIGRPLANTRSYVLDAGLEPVPLGARGELFVGTPGVARGYLDRPDLTAERFLPDPYAPEPGSRMYATGDVVRLRPDGNLEFLGRTDDQLKVRGFRVEPGEIEAAVLTHPAVEETVVVARGAGAERRLVCFWSAREGATADEAALRLHLADRLPGYMVPELFVAVDAFAHTPSGKVNRRALPDVPTARPAISTAYVAPSTPTEREVARLWREVLGVDSVGARDKFFEAGGNSLKLVELFDRLDEAFPDVLSVAQLFEHPTIAEMARAIDASAQDSPAAPVAGFEL